MQPIDTLLSARWIIPVEPDSSILSHHALAIQQGRIRELLPKAQAAVKYRPTHRVDLAHHVLIPGLVNAHTHAAMNLLRGLADDLPLLEWLNQHIWPAENRWVNEAFVYDGTLSALTEMLRGGITCFNDMYFFPEVTAAAVRQCGMRACIGLIIIDFPSAWAKSTEEYVSKGLTLQTELADDPLLSTAFAPHSPYTVSDAMLKKIGTLATEREIPIHVHVHETAAEVEQYRQQRGCRPLQRLAELGLVSPRLLAVHMTQLEPSEIALLANTGVHVVHCPESNMKLASGCCPVAKLEDAGVNIALGSDGAASNNDLNLFSEMRSAALLGKAVAGNAAALPAHQVLRMATFNGARALGLASEIGSLEPGKWADITAVDLGTVEAEPVYNPLSQLVYATSRQQVTDVWVAGRQLLKKRTLTTLHGDDILRRVQAWRQLIAE
jgi:5-methylthioadenosine/S-adenosylhomocysteine deaminase